MAGRCIKQLLAREGDRGYFTLLTARLNFFSFRTKTLSIGHAHVTSTSM